MPITVGHGPGATHAAGLYAPAVVTDGGFPPSIVPAWRAGGDSAIRSQPNTSFLFRASAAIFVVVAATVPNRADCFPQYQEPQNVYSSSFGDNIAVLYPKPPNHALFAPFEQLEPLNESRSLVGAQNFPYQTNPGPRNILNPSTPDDFSLPSQYLRIFQAPVAAQQPYRPLPGNSLDAPQDEASHFYTRQQLQAPPLRKILGLDQLNPEDSASRLFSQQQLQRTPLKPITIIGAQTPADSESSRFGKASDFPAQVSTPNRPYGSLDHAYPIEGYARANPYFPGNFPALATTPLKPTLVIDCQQPEYYPSFFLIPGVFIPSVTPVVVDDGRAGLGNYPPIARYRKLKMEELREIDRLRELEAEERRIAQALERAQSEKVKAKEERRLERNEQKQADTRQLIAQLAIELAEQMRQEAEIDDEETIVALLSQLRFF